MVESFSRFEKQLRGEESDPGMFVPSKVEARGNGSKLNHCTGVQKMGRVSPLEAVNLVDQYPCEK